MIKIIVLLFVGEFYFFCFEDKNNNLILSQFCSFMYFFMFRG